DANAVAEGEAELCAGVGEWPATVFDGPPQAAAEIVNATSAPPLASGARRPGVPISKGNAALPTRLRFRYDPRSEVGHRPSPSWPWLEGVRPRRTAGAVRFVLCRGGNKAPLIFTGE